MTDQFSDSGDDAIDTLLRSVVSHRWPGGLYYKPACLLAVLTGLEAGELDYSALDPAVVCAFYRALVQPIAPDRADQGWRPFWHLSNDGAWHFIKNGRMVHAEDFGRERKPNNRAELLRHVDYATVAPQYANLWGSLSWRRNLRSKTLHILRQDPDALCNALAGRNSDLDASSAIRIDPGERQPARTERRATQQGFCANSELRRAIERHAMEVISQYFSGDGWSVEDRSASSPYDLRCTRAGRVLYVEVKGTTSAGEGVRVTAGEIRFAADPENDTALAVLGEVQVNGSTVAGGTVKIVHPWRPCDADLEPIAFTYRLPST